MSTIRASAYAVVVAMVLVGCTRNDRKADTVSSAGDVEASTPSASAPAAGSARTNDPAAVTAGAVSTRTASVAGVGKFLTDAGGRAVYMFERDGKNVSMCMLSDGCARAWPPLAAAAPASADSSVQVSMLGMIVRSDNGRQATYNGMPLYYYEDDKKPGDIEGQGKNEFGGLWYLVSPSGVAIKTSAKRPT